MFLTSAITPSYELVWIGRIVGTDLKLSSSLPGERDRLLVLWELLIYRHQWSKEVEILLNAVDFSVLWGLGPL